MISFDEVGLEVSPALLLFLGFAVGIVAGFIGVGGGFLMTPTLIALGFPGSVAVGTGLASIAGNSVVATMRHRQLGNVDVRLGATMVLGTLAGAEVGVRTRELAQGARCGRRRHTGGVPPPDRLYRHLYWLGDETRQAPHRRARFGGLRVAA